MTYDEHIARLAKRLSPEFVERFQAIPIDRRIAEIEEVRQSLQREIERANGLPRWAIVGPAEAVPGPKPDAESIPKRQRRRKAKTGPMCYSVHTESGKQVGVVTPKGFSHCPLRPEDSCGNLGTKDCRLGVIEENGHCIQQNRGDCKGA